MERKSATKVKQLMAMAYERLIQSHSQKDIAECLGMTAGAISKRAPCPDSYSSMDEYLLGQFDPNFKAEMDAIRNLNKHKEPRELQGLFYAGIRNCAKVTEMLIDILDDGIVTPEEEAAACHLFAELQASANDALVEMKTRRVKAQAEGITE